MIYNGHWIKGHDENHGTPECPDLCENGDLGLGEPCEESATVVADLQADDKFHLGHFCHKHWSKIWANWLDHDQLTPLMEGIAA